MEIMLNTIYLSAKRCYQLLTELVGC